MGLERWLSVKSPCCPPRGPWFPAPSLGGSRCPVTPAQGIKWLLLASTVTALMYTNPYADTHMYTCQRERKAIRIILCPSVNIVEG